MKTFAIALAVLLTGLAATAQATVPAKGVQQQVVHYGDLKADLETEMRRIAAFCGIDVDEEKWPTLLASVGLDEMRREAHASGAHDTMSFVFEGGADRFFYKGDSGRWRNALTDDDLTLYEEAANTLDPELRRWLEGGRHAVGG